MHIQSDLWGFPSFVFVCVLLVTQMVMFSKDYSEPYFYFIYLFIYLFIFIFYFFYFLLVMFFLYSYFIYLFIYFWLCWVFGSREGFLQLRQVGATLHRGAGTALHRGARASHYRGLSCCGAQAPDAQAQ